MTDTTLPDAIAAGLREGLQAELAGALGAGEDLVTVPPVPSLPEADAGGGGGGGGSLSAEATRERESALAAELRTLAERTAELARMTQAQAALDPAMENYQILAPAGAP